MQVNFNSVRPTVISLFYKNDKGFSDFYNILNKNNDVPTSRSKWDITYNIKDETWKEIYKFPSTI